MPKLPTTTRKCHRVGSSIGICLPYRWVLANDIKNGSTVKIILFENKLIISNLANIHNGKPRMESVFDGQEEQ